jgi:hypothetical protein
MDDIETTRRIGGLIPMKVKLTLGDRVILRDITRAILGDKDLLPRFRGSCVITTRDLQRVNKKLEKGIDNEIGAVSWPFGG